MLVSVNDEVRRLEKMHRDHLLPSRICLVMVLNDKIDRTTGPCEEPLQLRNRLLEKSKIVQIYV
jgi:hypothetical protein